MTEEFDVSDTIAPKSDQLNADDLLAGPITVKLGNVTRGTPDQPISIEIGDGRQPYKPCKSMRRLMVAVWGKDGNKWQGQSMTLACDPEVSYGGVKVGGIRIKEITGIDKPVTIMLTAKRGKRVPYIVHPLPLVETYPNDLFEKNVQAWSELIETGRMTAKQVSDKASERAPLTDEQMKILQAIKVKVTK